MTKKAENFTMNNTSLRRRLTINSLLVFFLTWCLTLVITFYNEYQNISNVMEVDVQDYVLEFTRELKFADSGPNQSKVQQIIEQAKGWEFDLGEIQVWYKNELVYSTPGLPMTSLPKQTGTVETEFGTMHHQAFVDEEINLIVPILIDDEWAYFIPTMTQGLFPFLLLLPLASIALYFGIDHSLRPLLKIANRIEKIDPANLTPLSFEQLPEEIRPLVKGLNQLLFRLDAVLENERNFTANAGHELLTPLAAIKSEAQLCQRQLSKTAPQIVDSLKEIDNRVDRATHTVEQLVLLSRFEYQAGKRLESAQEVNLVDLVQEEVAEQGNKIEAKELDFDFSTNTEAAILIRGNITALQVLSRNLVDNAVRYTPENGYIKIYIHSTADAVIFGIENSGNSLPKFLSTRIFQRFARGPGEQESGSGLGLSIVQQVAIQHQAQLNIDSGPQGLGLKVEISFPAIST